MRVLRIEAGIKMPFVTDEFWADEAMIDPEMTILCVIRDCQHGHGCILPCDRSILEQVKSAYVRLSGHGRHEDDP